MSRRWCSRPNAARGGGGATKLSALQIRSRPGPALAAGQGDAGESSGRGVGDGALHGLRLDSYCCPPVGGKDDDGDVSPGEVLLKDKVLVAGDKGLETGLFGFVQQLPVRDAGPAHLGGGPHVMALQNAAQAPRDVFVEQNPHPLEGEPILAKRSTAFSRSRGNSNISVAISSAVNPSLALSTTA